MEKEALPLNMKNQQGGVGIANMQLGEMYGSCSSFPITDNDQLMLVTDKEINKMSCNDIRIAGEQTQGVTLFNVSDEEKVVSVAKLDENEYST